MYKSRWSTRNSKVFLRTVFEDMGTGSGSENAKDSEHPDSEFTPKARAGRSRIAEVMGVPADKIRCFAVVHGVA